MYFTYYYFTASLILFYLASISHHIVLTLAILWIAASLLIVSIAYLFQRPAIFRKRIDGTIPLYIQWIFVPFFLGVQLYNSWARKNDKVPAIQEIDDNTYLACRLFPRDIERLDELNITTILDVTAEFSGLNWSANNEHLNYLNIPVLDHQSPTNEQIKQALYYLTSHSQQGQKVVIHCALGRGRSVLIAAAYLLSKNPDDSVEQTLAKINGIRRTANLNKTQKKALAKAHQQGITSQLNRLAIVANPVSGGGKWPENKQEILQRLSQHFIVRIYETTEQESATEKTQTALNDGAQFIIAAGGDGTVSEVAAQILHQDITLGILPMGTTNAFCHVLYGFVTKLMPVHVCCDIIEQQATKTVNVAKCNDELVLLVASIGLSQIMIAEADRDEKNQAGQFAYIKGLWNAIQEHQLFELTVTFDDHSPQTITTPSMVIANSAPSTTILAQGGGSTTADENSLDITWLPGDIEVNQQLINILDLALCGLREEKPNEDIKFKQVNRVKITSKKTISYAIDGEDRSAGSIQMTLEKKALRLFARNQ
ncbi:diacylglycerol kinase family protein [Thalassotalea sp. G2M2-11]|uniref:diacylglycerol kinase family protein n=1 Tax=Thalassotalea sp. G2M2-11 TaxID=2787627 RepID=UPI0019CF7AE0|nr:diacylglycerol kinase family protein [Thalassotalea sp. G2M2-11]